MKNLKDCLNINENAGWNYNQNAFTFTPDKDFKNGADGYDVFDNINELKDFFDNFLILMMDKDDSGDIKAASSLINGLSGLIKGFEDASKYIKDPTVEKIYKKMSLAITKAQDKLNQQYALQHKYNS